MIPFRDNIPSRSFPFATLFLIGVNCATFLYELSLGRRLTLLILQFGVIPARFQLTPSLQMISKNGVDLFTSMFLHGGWIHLLGNMWFLWIFGDNVEDLMGHFRFLVFYLSSGVVGGLVHIFFNLESPLPSIGASGAVAGVLGAYLVSYPFARVLTLVPLFLFWPIVELPAMLVLGSWFLIQLLNGTVSLDPTMGSSDQVAYWAHVGGFLSGITLLGFLKQRRRKVRVL
ncbi:MAG: rhomboid family intramembrane serine protease [Acidobacteria bacterium]|nr:rhomboid family intramembrane serine protease [Acidobacteriota bacterium]